VTAGQYTATSHPARALDEIADWIAQSPEQLGVFAFCAARMIESNGLCYRTVFGRVIRAGIDAGLAEAEARARVFRGFAAAAAGHPEPPPDLEDVDC
jgi:hypothetical protein